MHTLGFMGPPGHSEIILIVFVIVLLFGAKKLPELSRALGKSLGEFRKGQREGADPALKDDEAAKKEIADESKAESKK